MLGSITISVTDSSLKSHNNSLLSLTSAKSAVRRTLFQIDAEDYAHSIMRLYHSDTLRSGDPATPVLGSHRSSHLQRRRCPGYLQSLSEKGSTPTLNFMFTLGMKSIFSVLSCDELRGGLLDLVHLTNEGTAGPAWPPTAGERMQIQARAERVETRRRTGSRGESPWRAAEGALPPLPQHSSFAAPLTAPCPSS